MIVRSTCLLVVLGLGWSHPVTEGADLNHPRVPGFERFYAAPLPKPVDDDDEPVRLDPVTGGRILVGELNCLACHEASGEFAAKISSRQAPVLDHVASRVKVAWLRSYLANPHDVKPGTTMPDLIATLPEAARAASVEALTHFLASTGVVQDGHSDPVAAKKGEALFQTIGCLACHNTSGENSPDLATSVTLPDLGKKYTGPSLAAFLKDPLNSRPSGRMPSLGLSDEQSRNLAHHFVRDGKTSPNARYSLFQGAWKTLPRFSELKPVATGESAGFDLSVANRHQDYAIRFVTNLRIPKTGEYQFWLGSDDGSKLWIDHELVVDCDGIHPHQTNEGRKVLNEGFHEVIVEYFQGGGEETLEVQIAGQGLARQPLSGFAFLEAKDSASVPEQQQFSLDPGLVATGREVFATIGCASCHQMKTAGQFIASQLKARPLAIVTPGSGCLAENVTGRSPRYGLSPAQRASLNAVIRSSADENAAESVHRKLATMNCYACHSRGKLGGVEESRDAAFASLQKEMGDEGRLPPTLTGVGDKLRPEWLRHVLLDGADDRKNYLIAKMPKFGATNVEPLVALFAAVDRQPESMPRAEFADPDYRVKGAGRHLVGGQALSCIKCHDFGRHPSTGVRAINLTTMNQRLRADWFYRYVLDPQAYRRGTRMPAAWPFGRATIREILNADVNLQVQAVWMFLSDGDRAAVPVGLVREPIELKPESEPVVYRNFIEGAGSRAIGVGYPEGVNLAFDANNMRLAMIWHGAFIDASRHWTGRGQGFEPPLGDDVLPLPGGVPFLVLDTPDRQVSAESGRDLGYRFLGYRLDEQQRPIFRYSLAEIIIEDHPVPFSGNGKPAGLARTLRFQGSGSTTRLWYRAAATDQIESSGEGGYRIDGVWTMIVEPTGAEKPFVRDMGGKKELLVPVRMQAGKAEIKQRYDW